MWNETLSQVGDRSKSHFLWKWKDESFTSSIGRAHGSNQPFYWEKLENLDKQYNIVWKHQRKERR